MRSTSSGASCVVILAMLTLVPPFARADGEPDESFATIGAVAVEVGDVLDAARGMAIQPNGRIVVVGDSPNPQGVREMVVARLRPSGELDTTFAGTGVVRTAIEGLLSVGGVALDMAGRIVVVGSTRLNGIDQAVVVRVLATGQLDPDFALVGFLHFPFGGDSTGEAVAVGLDGKIVVAGTRTHATDVARFGIARLLDDGRFDDSFSNDGRQTIAYNDDAFAHAVAVQDDGKVLVAGSVETVDEGSDFALIRLKLDGNLDNFHSNGKVNTDFGGDEVGEAVAVLPDGHIVVAGTRTTGGGSDFAVAMYREDGPPETAFGGNGKRVADFAANEFGRAVAAQNDGKVVVAGQRVGTNGSDFAVARFNADGSLDSSLDEDGKLRADLFVGQSSQDDAVAVALDSNGRLVVAGSTQMAGDSDFAVARFLSNVQVPLGVLEIPGNGSTQSGVGLSSGWLCNASNVSLRVDGVTEHPGYGTPRDDTRGVCGDSNNGFGLLFNWNRLGDGLHIVRAIADGKQFASALFGVATLGAPFLRGVSATYGLPNFPEPGKMVTIRWAEPSQSFVIQSLGDSPVSLDAPQLAAPAASLGFLENPQPGSFQSGVGIISGWICDASSVRIQIDELPTMQASYGTPRGDTEGVCGDTNNGFGLLFNWGLLGDGAHTLVARADGMVIGTANITVTTLGTSFLRGARGHYILPDFPRAGSLVEVDWIEGQQNFVITRYEE